MCSTFTLTTWFKIDFKRLTVCIHKHIHSHKHFRAHVLMISILWPKEKATPLIICCLFKGRKVRGEGPQCVSLHICSCLCERMHVYSTCKMISFALGVSYRSIWGLIIKTLHIFAAENVIKLYNTMKG